MNYLPSSSECFSDSHGIKNKNGYSSSQQCQTPVKLLVEEVLEMEDKEKQNLCMSGV